MVFSCPPVWNLALNLEGRAIIYIQLLRRESTIIINCGNEKGLLTKYLFTSSVYQFIADELENKWHVNTMVQVIYAELQWQTFLLY